MTTATNPKSPMAPIIYGERCVGFIFTRRGGFEAFDIDERSLGTFDDERDALAAIFNPKPAGAP